MKSLTHWFLHYSYYLIVVVLSFFCMQVHAQEKKELSKSLFSLVQEERPDPKVFKEKIGVYRELADRFRDDVLRYAQEWDLYEVPGEDILVYKDLLGAIGDAREAALLLEKSIEEKGKTVLGDRWVPLTVVKGEKQWSEKIGDELMKVDGLIKDGKKRILAATEKLSPEEINKQLAKLEGLKDFVKDFGKRLSVVVDLYKQLAKLREQWVSAVDLELGVKPVGEIIEDYFPGERELVAERVLPLTVIETVESVMPKIREVFKDTDFLKVFEAILAVFRGEFDAMNSDEIKQIRSSAQWQKGQQKLPITTEKEKALINALMMAYVSDLLGAKPEYKADEASFREILSTLSDFGWVQPALPFVQDVFKLAVQKGWPTVLKLNFLKDALEREPSMEKFIELALPIVNDNMERSKNNEQLFKKYEAILADLVSTWQKLQKMERERLYEESKRGEGWWGWLTRKGEKWSGKVYKKTKKVLKSKEGKMVLNVAADAIILSLPGSSAVKLPLTIGALSKGALGVVLRTSLGLSKDASVSNELMKFVSEALSKKD
ncbi:MAG: hypothetical protein JW725_04705 [Candidatus Babeliaceae bacterium]|nr:hypothetical protein [Candidatus Babeliaceae bacterium]